eukprot:scaffold518497_cov36-Prasinocladus_malaysianus.AAC.1
MMTRAASLHSMIIPRSTQLQWIHPTDDYIHTVRAAIRVYLIGGGSPHVSIKVSVFISQCCLSSDCDRGHRALNMMIV